MMIFIILLFVSIVALGLSLWFVSTVSPLSIQDVPNARSLHKCATPRTGGVAIVVAIFLGWLGLFLLGYQSYFLTWIIAASFLVALVSFVDDVVSLATLPRLVMHGIAAALLLYGCSSLPWGGVVNALVWVVIIWVINLYNFMDGMDGLSAGMAIFGFGVLGIIGWQQDAQTYAFYCWVVAFASVGFLVLNFPPARIFMGDVGSVNFGLLVAAFSLWGFQEGLFSLWVPLLIFSPFIADATVTVIVRLFKREMIWIAHRDHFYQRLVLAGWSHKRTVLYEYVLMFCCGISSILMVEISGMAQLAVIGFWSVLYCILLTGVQWIEVAAVEQKR